MASGTLVSGTESLLLLSSPANPSLRRQTNLGRAQRPSASRLEPSGYAVAAIPLSGPLTVPGTPLLRPGASDAAAPHSPWLVPSLSLPHQRRTRLHSGSRSPHVPSPSHTLSALHGKGTTLQSGSGGASSRGGRVQAARGKAYDFISLFVKPTWHSPIGQGVTQEAPPKAKDSPPEPRAHDAGAHTPADVIEGPFDIGRGNGSAGAETGGEELRSGASSTSPSESTTAPASPSAPAPAPASASTPPSMLPDVVPRQVPSELQKGSRRELDLAEELRAAPREDRTDPFHQKSGDSSEAGPGFASVTDVDKVSSTVTGTADGTSAATVCYVLRLSTSRLPGGGIRDPNGGVQIAIIGESGEAISARVFPCASSGAPLPLPQPAGLTAAATAAARGEPKTPRSATQVAAGTNIARDSTQQGTPASSGTAPGQLAPPASSAGSTSTVFSSSGEGSFQEGSQAVVCLQGPDVRPVAALWVAPLTDTWRLAEASLCVADTETLRRSSSALQTPSSVSVPATRGDSPDAPPGTGTEGLSVSDVATEQEAAPDRSAPSTIQETPQGQGASAGASTDGAPKARREEDRASRAGDQSPGPASGDSSLSAAGEASTSAEGMSTSAGGPSTSAGEEGVGSLYVFAPEEGELLGAAGSALAVELRPAARRRCTQGQLLGLLEGSDLLRKADGELEERAARQAEQLRRILAQREGMEEYGKLKEWLLLSTSLLVVVGTAVAVQVGGESAGAFFAAGGLASLLFLLKIQRQVDAIPGSSIPDAAAEQDKRATAVLGVLASESPVVPSGARPGGEESQGMRVSLGWLQIDGPVLIRLITLGVCFGAAVFLLSQSQGAQPGPALASGLPHVQPQEAIAAFLGFCTHRVSIVLAAFRRKA